MNIEKLTKQLTYDEGRVVSAYPDSRGYWTIGVGHLIDRRKGGKLSDPIIDAILREDITKAAWQLDAAIPWWRNLDDDRQDALVNMTFNLGIDGLMGFHHFLAALQEGDTDSAARFMLESLWATQVGDRATRLADVIRGYAL